jgi:predicted unusual protein kinase regulating ubiquinone biosynthesis (AarF/ABC1/UbiB family)
LQTRPNASSLKYDPADHDATLRRAGAQVWHRRVQLLWTLGAFAVGFWWDNQSTGEAQLIKQRKRARWLKDELVKHGATFIKIGQVLSTRPDLVPLPYVDEMATLQDQVPPFDSELAHRIIREELGRPIEDVFQVVNPFPLAAASIGQVYKAKLKEDGRDVVVKVQRPGLVPVMQLDLAIIRQLTTFVDARPWLSRGMPYTAILDEFGHSLFVQADYTKEGEYAERFREHFKTFKGVTTPRIHWNLTTSRVMTMDYVHGMKPTDLVALEDAGLSFQEIVRTGVRATIKQILEDGFFHADVHPGNLFVDYEGQLVYIDFGMVGEIGEDVQETIVDIFLHSVHRNYEALVEDFIRLQFLSPEVDRQVLVPVAAFIFQSQYGETGERLTVKQIFASISQVLYEYPFRIPEKIAFILRTIITLEGIIHKLWPDFRFLEVAAPYAAKIMLTDAKASIREKLVNELFIDGKFRPDRLGRLFGTATMEPSFKFGEVAPSVVRYLVSAEGRRVREGLLQAAADADLAYREESAWGTYLERAAADPDWTLDDILRPILAFACTAEGVDFLHRLLETPQLWQAAGGSHDAVAGLGGLLEGRALAPEGLDALFDTGQFLLQQPDLLLQPLVERGTAFLLSDPGRFWFESLGKRLQGNPGAFSGRVLALLELAARHPHLDISPLVKAFFTLATAPEGRPWQDLLVQWFRGPAGEGNRAEGLWKALQPLLADGRLRVSDLAGPTVGLLFSKEGAPLREEVVATIRNRLPDVGGLAQGLWRGLGAAWERLRGGIEPKAVTRPDDHPIPEGEAGEPSAPPPRPVPDPRRSP